MKIARLEKKVYKHAIETLKNGGLLIAPSDTVYGLLVDATNEKAVKKLIRFKNRPSGKPISVFVSDFSMLKRCVKVTSKQLHLLAELLPGPFTVVLASKHRVSKLLESEKGTLGVRLIDYPFIKKLVTEFGKPVSATSANLSGRSPYYQIEPLLRSLSEKKHELIDLVVNAGKLPHNKPSTVIDLTTSKIKTLRKGDIIQISKQSFVSTSDLQTKKIGQYLLKKYNTHTAKKPLVFVIEGELGVGKTMMIKGIAEVLGVHTIISPTYVVYYEYKIRRNDIKTLYHFDLYQVEDREEFKYLHIGDLLKSHTLLCFEWGEKTAEIMKELKHKANVVHIAMKYISETEREIKISRFNTQ